MPALLSNVASAPDKGEIQISLHHIDYYIANFNSNFETTPQRCLVDNVTKITHIIPTDNANIENLILVLYVQKKNCLDHLKSF